LDFTSFSQQHSWELHTSFTAGLFWIRQFFTLLPINNKTNNNKHVICQLYNMKLPKEVKSNLKQPSCKKMCGYCEKRCEIQGGGQEWL